MISLPLMYSFVPIGFAWIDDDREDLTDYPYFGVIIPRKTRKVCSADVLLALFLEDDTLLQRCRPVLSSRGRLLPLASLVLRPDLLTVPEHEVRDLRSSIGRVVYETPNRCDCRKENLHELTPGNVQ